MQVALAFIYFPIFFLHIQKYKENAFFLYLAEPDLPNLIVAGSIASQPSDFGNIVSCPF